MATIDTSDLQRARETAEIEKIKAETRTLNRSGWASLGTVAAVVAGLSGVAALVTAIPNTIIQWQQRDDEIAQAKSNALLEVLKVKEDALALRAQAVAASEQLLKDRADKAELEAEVLKVTAERDTIAQQRQELLTQVSEAADQLARLLEKQRTVLATINTSSLPIATQQGISAVTDQLGTAQTLAEQKSRLVYLQFQGAIDRATMRDLQARLGSAGFLVPGVERVKSPFKSQVKYFGSEDEAVAQAVADQVNQFLTATCGSWPTPIKAVPASGDPSLQQVEVWISGTCTVDGGP